MSCILGLLEGYAPQVTEQLRPRLRGVFGGMIRAYLPQEWVFELESEVYTMSVDADGLCAVRVGRSAAPDVILRVGHDRLRAALEKRDRAAVPPGPLSVEFPTRKGESAYQFLRSRFGL
jgi:hypothetical protein